MRAILINQFKQVCPNCGGELTDATYVDRGGLLFFYRTIFECEPDNWALMTRMEDFNTIGYVSEEQDRPDLDLPMARVKLDLTVKAVQYLIKDGVASYPLSTVEKITSPNESFRLGKFRGDSHPPLHDFCIDLARNYRGHSETEKEKIALELALRYVASQTDNDFAGILHDGTAAADILQSLGRLAEIYVETGESLRGQSMSKAARILQENAAQPVAVKAKLVALLGAGGVKKQVPRRKARF